MLNKKSKRKESKEKDDNKKENKNKKDFGIIRELITNFIGKMKGNIREDKFVDENYPKYIIDN